MKKGFTLIELLAVIVILAIIALIATPIVLNIINDTKESAILRSAEFYLDGVETSIATSVLKGIAISDGTYYIMEDGNICLEEYDVDTKRCKDNDLKPNNNELKVEVDGEIPNSGRRTIDSGKISTIVLNINNKVVLKNENNELVYMTTVANHIKNLYKETTTTTVNNIEYSLDETHSLMNDRLGNSKVAKLDGNIRYYGANPNNYIDIGDRDSEGNIIFWRIIGLFKDIEVTDEEGNVVKTEDLVKIIRADFLSSGDVDGFSWDYTETGSFDNNWYDSTLNVMLNEAYYKSGTTNYYNNSRTPTSLNFTSTGLSDGVHNKIERVNWSLGGLPSGSTVYVDTSYGYEKSGTNPWFGKIALIYLSDYGYSTDLSNCKLTLRRYNVSTCTTTNWMYDSTQSQWTLSHNSLYNVRVFTVGLEGYIGDAGDLEYVTQGVRPVLYLKSNVGIVEEKETSNSLKYFVVE